MLASSPSPALVGSKTVQPPPRSDTISRPRLLQRLDEAKHARLTLLSAPAGAGKSTLLHDWLARRTEHVVWISLNSGDNDLVLFWRYVVTAVRGFAGTFGRDVLPLLGGGSDPSIETLTATLVNELSRLKGETILALDNLQAVDAPRVHASVAGVVEHLPSNVHAVVASRADPHLPLARLRSLGDLAELRGEELQLTAAETGEFLNGVMGLSLSHRDVDTIHARTEGWAAGLRLAALALAAPADVSAVAAHFGGSHPYVLDYFADEVLSGLPDELYSFLIHTSITETICAGLGEALTGRGHGQATLRRLLRANLFLVPLDAQSRWYRYHSCFLQALSRRLEDEGTDRLKQLHERAMEWYLQRGLTREGVHHALAAGNFDAAADAIERRVDELIWERAEIAELLVWLDALPREVLQARPRLSLAHAWALALTGQLESIEEHLANAEQSLGRLLLSSSPGSRASRSRALLSESALGEIAAVRAVTAGLQIDTARLTSWSSEAVTHAPGNQFLRTVLALSRGRAHDFAADVPRAMEAYAEARDLSESIGNTHIMAVATSRLAELWALQGELHQAADTHQRVLHIAAEESHHRSAVSAIAHVGLGGLRYEWNDLSGATAHFDEGMKLAASWGHLETLKGSYFGLARTKLAQGESEEARELLSQAEALARHSNAPRSIVWIHAMQARVSLAHKDVAAAVRWTQHSPLHPGREPMRLFTGEYTTLARVLTVLGRYGEALTILDGLLELATAERWMGLIIEVRVLQALALQARGSLRSALLPLRKALALAAPEGYLRTFLDEGDALAGLLERASAHDEMPPYLDTVLDAFRMSPHPPTADMKRRGGGALTQREREVLRHIAAGESNQEIAQQLVLTLATVKRHASNIFDKLGATSRTQAVARARQRGLV
jgi:LuxR family maltose regulon positive regulatory protein